MSEKPSIYPSEAAMNIHGTARLTPASRSLLVEELLAGNCFRMLHHTELWQDLFSVLSDSQ